MTAQEVPSFIRSLVEFNHLYASGIRDFSHISLTTQYYQFADFNRILQDVSFRNATMRKAQFANFQFTNCIFDDAILSSASFFHCVFKNCSFVNTNFSASGSVFGDCTFDGDAPSNFAGANLNNISFGRSDLSGVLFDARTQYFNCDLIHAVNISESINLHTQKLPPVGESFIAYKKAVKKKLTNQEYFEVNQCIITLEIPSEALRSSATTDKCRASAAKVVAIKDLLTGKDLPIAYSQFNREFVYELNKISEVKGFNTNRWKECTSGIHFFLSEELARDYIF